MQLTWLKQAESRKVYIFTRQEYFNIKQGLTDLAKTQTKIKRALG